MTWGVKFRELNGSNSNNKPFTNVLGGNLGVDDKGEFNVNSSTSFPGFDGDVLFDNKTGRMLDTALNYDPTSLSYMSPNNYLWGNGGPAANNDLMNEYTNQAIINLKKQNAGPAEGLWGSNKFLTDNKQLFALGNSVFNAWSNWENNEFNKKQLKSELALQKDQLAYNREQLAEQRRLNDMNNQYNQDTLAFSKQKFGDEANRKNATSNIRATYVT